MDKEEPVNVPPKKIDVNSCPNETEELVHFIGERNAVIFKAASGEPLPPIELPDDFFELSKDDLNTLFKDLKQKRNELENAPFRTKAVREMERSAAQLACLAQYTKTVIRVLFPNRLVMQAVFNHSDTVQTILDFLKNFLDPSCSSQYYLYTAPPKTILRPESTLIEAQLTPRALLYFGTADSTESTIFLKPHFLTTLTSVRLASQAALQYRKEDIGECSKKTPLSGEMLEEDKVSVAGPSTSRNDKPSTSKRVKAANTKVPKWFKP